MKAVLAYSGGLDTSVCVKILQEKYNCDVITVTIDVGISESELKQAEEKAKKLGVLKHFTIDAKEEFARDYVFKAIKANASYEGYPLSTALARPLTALKVVKIAKEEGADALAHGATGKGNDQFRFDAVFKSEAPEMKIIAPVRELNLTREESIAYAKENDIPWGMDPDKSYSIDENLWGRSIEGGILEDPSVEPPEEIYEWTKITASGPETVTLEFKEGVPVALNGTKKGPVELIQEMNAIAGKHGVGRIDMIEDRILGIKARENYECPGAVSIIMAHKSLEHLVLKRKDLKLKEAVEPVWSELVYNGAWNDPQRIKLDAFIESTQEQVEGTVKLKLDKKYCAVAGMESKKSLYSQEAASFDKKISQ
ncbi:argininosuccinate synthase [archaeon]|nr:argininosuccinate synthase [archaeon]